MYGSVLTILFAVDAMRDTALSLGSSLVVQAGSVTFSHLKWADTIQTIGGYVLFAASIGVGTS